MKTSARSARVSILSLFLLVFALGARGWAQEEPTCKFHFINVGQAAATLIETKCGVVLIDAGAQDDEFADKLVAYLAKVFEGRPELNKTIELLGITHSHIHEALYGTGFDGNIVRTAKLDGTLSVRTKQ
ncbi:MAG: hypothetical protein ABMA13_18130 [Chthoniobacteraceae bacterium]